MEVNYKNCIRYKNFLDLDEQEYKDRLITINQIKELKAFKYKGYKEKIQKDRIKKNRIKGEMIKKADDAFFNNRQLILEQKLKYNDNIINSLRYIPNKITIQKNINIIEDENRNIKKDILIRKIKKSVDNNSLNNISSNSVLNNLKCSDLLTTEASLDPKLERKETIRTNEYEKKNKLNKFPLSRSFDQDFEKESERDMEKEKLIKLRLEREKLEEEFEILQKLVPNSLNYHKLKKLKLYDKKVLSLSNVNQLVLKTSPSKVEEKKQGILPKISRNNNKLVGNYNTGSNLPNKKILTTVSSVNRTKNSEDLESKIFVTNNQKKDDINITKSPSMSDISKYFDDDHDILEEVEQVRKAYKNNVIKKESKLLKSIYRTSESRENKIKKIKKNYKNLPLEDYQLMLLNSISNQLEPNSITDLSQNFLRLRVLTDKVPLLEKMDYHQMVKKLKNDLSSHEEMKKIKKIQSEKNKIQFKPIKYSNTKNIKIGLENSGKCLPHIIKSKLKK